MSRQTDHRTLVATCHIIEMVTSLLCRPSRTSKVTRHVTEVTQVTRFVAEVTVGRHAVSLSFGRDKLSRPAPVTFLYDGVSL